MGQPALTPPRKLQAIAAIGYQMPLPGTCASLEMPAATGQMQPMRRDDEDVRSFMRSRNKLS